MRESLFAADCSLFDVVACWSLIVARCVLYVACCLLHVVRCLLLVDCCVGAGRWYVVGG